jgi:hypothetical protein
MKLKTIYDLIMGRRDLRSLKILNELFGKKYIFIEKPNKYYNKIKKHIRSGKINEIFILTPENYEDMIQPEFPNITKKQFEEYFIKILKLSKLKNISVVLHVHLNKNPKSLKFNEKLNRTKRALDYLKKNNIEVKKVGFGWWRTSHSDPELKIIVNKLKLKLAKRKFHIYDFWLK